MSGEVNGHPEQGTVSWWVPNRGAADRKLLYRERFEKRWRNLPEILILAALPGWGKQTWVDQCCDFLARSRPEMAQLRVQGLEGIELLLDGQRKDSEQLLCLVDARVEGTSAGFWDTLSSVLESRPWVRCVAVAYEDPGLPKAVVLGEEELAFSSSEQGAICELLSQEGLLNDLLFTSERERGCPYLVQLQIARLSRLSGGSWIATDPRAEVRLLGLLEKELQEAGLDRYPIGQVLIAARQFRAFTLSLLRQVGAPVDQVRNLESRLSAIPLFDLGEDEETQEAQWVWRKEVWTGLGEDETEEELGARLEVGRVAIEASGRIAPALYYLLATGRLAEAEDLVARNFRWLLMFCERWSAEALLSIELDPSRTPALALLGVELEQRQHGPSEELRSRAYAALQELQRAQSDSALEEIERLSLLVFAATMAGRRAQSQYLVRTLLRVFEAVEGEQRLPVTSSERVRAVGACYLAYWAALQTDLHLEALRFGRAMVRHSEPTDRIFLFEMVSLVTEEDLHGIRSTSESGERPTEQWHSHAKPLLDLEEGKDSAALDFLKPILAHERPSSRSALDAMVLLTRAIGAPQELTVQEVEGTLRRSRDAWMNRKASSFLTWAAIVAYGSLGAHEEATRALAEMGEGTEFFDHLARLSLALWEGEIQEAYKAVERLDVATPPRLKACAWTLMAAAHVSIGETERALFWLENLWRENPSPRLFRFALRLVSQEAFESLVELSDQLPRSLSQVLAAAAADGRPVAWAQAPKLTPSELDILRLLSLGKTNQQIADARFVTLGTVRSQLKTLYRKLQVGNRVEALRIARDSKLLLGSAESFTDPA